MKHFKLILAFLTASLLLLASCTKDGSNSHNPSRGDTPTPSEGFTIDNTWDGETVIGF